MKDIIFTPTMIDNWGIEWELDDYGNVKYENGYGGALEQLGYEPISEERALRMTGARNPMELQNDNTYNRGAHLWHDANYGIEEVRGGVLVVFKTHLGGDVRGNYTEPEFYFKPDTSLDMEMHELSEIFNPELHFSFRVGDKEVEGYLMGGGYVEFTENEAGVSDEDVWEAHNEVSPKM